MTSTSTSGVSESSHSSIAVSSPTPFWLRAWGIGLSVIAMSVAAYLFIVSSLVNSQPLGCGEDSGCGQVLASRWSQFFGIPVTVPAAATYVLSLGLWLGLGRMIGLTPMAGRILVGSLVGAWVLAALWFVGIQLFYLQAICPWCLVEHGLGVALAGLLCLAVWHRSDNFAMATTTSSSGTSPDAGRPSGLTLGPAGIGRGLTVGLVLFLVLVGGQVFGPYREPGAARLSGSGGRQEGQGIQRTLTLLDGQLALAADRVPVMGSPDATHFIVMMFDYCCPHCQTTHGYLREAIERHPDQLAVLLLPTPLNSDCNPHWEETQPRFVESCELTRLALAVWLVDPQQFAVFDEWLFASEQPRTAGEARARADTLVDPAALVTALGDPEIETWIRRNVDGYAASQAGRIPVIMSPSFDAVVGRPADRRELLGILSQELGLEFD